MPVDATIETARLRGERARPGDFADYFALFADPRVTATLTVDGQPLDEAEARRWFARKLDGWAREGIGIWMFRDRADGRFVGYGGLQRASAEQGDLYELLYAALPEFWGRGLTTELAAAVLRVGFEQLGLAEVVSYALPVNRASQRVMEKVGFRYERDIVHAGLPHQMYRVRGAGWGMWNDGDSQERP